MTDPALLAEGLSKQFGGIEVVRDVSLRLAPGERRALLGPNGAGKTTLFNLIAGALSADSGRVRLLGRDVTRLGQDARARAGLGRSFQQNRLFESLSVRENLAMAALVAQGRSGGFWRDPLQSATVQAAVTATAAQVGLTAALETPAETLSYGERRLLELGLALATAPKMLLLDEPSAGLGPGETDAVHRLVAALPRSVTLLVIEHDLDLAFAVADRVTVLSAGAVIFDGPPEAARSDRQVREIYLGDLVAPSSEPAGGDDA